MRASGGTFKLSLSEDGLSTFDQTAHTGLVVRRQVRELRHYSPASRTCQPALWKARIRANEFIPRVRARVGRNDALHGCRFYAGPVPPGTTAGSFGALGAGTFESV
jgi:hypothetical protein